MPQIFSLIMTLKSNLASYVCTIQHFEKPAQLKFVSQPVPCYHSLTQKVKVLSSPRHEEIAKRKVFFLKVKETVPASLHLGCEHNDVEVHCMCVNQLTFLWRLSDFMEFIDISFLEISWNLDCRIFILLGPLKNRTFSLPTQRTLWKPQPKKTIFGFTKPPWSSRSSWRHKVVTCEKDHVSLTCTFWYETRFTDFQFSPQFVDTAKTRVILLLLMRPVWHMVSWQAQWCCNIL